MNYTGEIDVKESLAGSINMLKVINGYSAYELALKCGFKGTLEQWLESLKVKGDPGTMELFGELDAKGKRIMNVADPEEDGDAVNLKCVKDKISFISKPVEAVLTREYEAGEGVYATIFDVEADWLDFDNLPNGFELTIIPNAQNGNRTMIRINGGDAVGVVLTTSHDDFLPFNTFEAGLPHKLLYWCAGTGSNGSKIDCWYSVTALSEPLRELSFGNALPIENGGTGGKTAEEARNNIGAMPAEATSLYGKDIDIDVLIKPGSYYGRNITNSPFTNLYLEVGYGPLEYLGGPSGTELVTSSYFYQKALDLTTGTMAFRCSDHGPGRFQNVEWEYENPAPLWQAGRGTVVKTNERFNGEAVYTTIIFIDNFEDGKEIDITGTEPGENGGYASGIYGRVLRYQGYLFGSDHECTKTLPYIQPSTENVAYAWLTFKNDQTHSGYKIKMQMHGYNAPFDANGRYVCNQGYVQIWFVKP